MYINYVCIFMHVWRYQLFYCLTQSVSHKSLTREINGMFLGIRNSAFFISPLNLTIREFLDINILSYLAGGV